MNRKYSFAIAALQIALDTARINGPVFEHEGRLEEASQANATAESCQQAIEALNALEDTSAVHQTIPAEVVATNELIERLRGANTDLSNRIDDLTTQLEESNKRFAQEREDNIKVRDQLAALPKPVGNPGRPRSEQP